MPIVEFALEIRVPKEILSKYSEFALGDGICVSRRVMLAFPPMLGVSYYGDNGNWETGPLKRVLCDIDAETYWASADLQDFPVKTDEDFITLLKHIASRNWDTSRLSEKMLKIMKEFSAPENHV